MMHKTNTDSQQRVETRHRFRYHTKKAHDEWLSGKSHGQCSTMPCLSEHAVPAHQRNGHRTSTYTDVFTTKCAKDQPLENERSQTYIESSLTMEGMKQMFTRLVRR
jgi:hypothetical protein